MEHGSRSRRGEKVPYSWLAWSHYTIPGNAIKFREQKVRFYSFMKIMKYSRHWCPLRFCFSTENIYSLLLGLWPAGSLQMLPRAGIAPGQRRSPYRRSHPFLGATGIQWLVNARLLRSILQVALLSLCPFFSLALPHHQNMAVRAPPNTLPAHSSSSQSLFPRKPNQQCH